VIEQGRPSLIVKGNQIAAIEFTSLLMNDIGPQHNELLLDTHVHSRYSDGTAGIPRIERHCRNRGMGLAITDHNEIRGAVQLFERERVPALPGIEVGTEEGVDLLVYFNSASLLEDFFIGAVEPFLRTRFMVRSWIRALNCLTAAKEMGGYVSLAHPFALGRKSLEYQHGRRGKPFVETIMESVDAIELYNGGVHRAANARAGRYAATAGKRLTVGSDAHRLRSIGTCGTFLDTAAGTSTGDLFHALATHNDLRFKVRVSRSAVSLPTLGIIALKHTHHFMRPTGRRRRA
jgi:predicted metal-dependent phosphoesterase TrpH